MVQIVNEIKLKSQEQAWEEMVSMGIEAREHLDNNQWELGDIALNVSKSYGEDAIGKYANDIGMPKKTLMNYRTTSGRYPIEIRNKYKKLSFSHFKTAASLEKPEAWLEQADDNNWSVEKMDYEIKKAYDEIRPPEITDEKPEVYKCTECGHWRLKDISSYEICKGHYTFSEGKTMYK